ncbi:hypothetical protein DVH24_040159 [Malus domestica]|uniref:Uncharacterized protein n=1 Tax=Malus domestica TaxID=3750 RepID=A0A498ITP2_MALDO|nr:hypothetical protein DVH24_040159 [Malus domestica]
MEPEASELPKGLMLGRDGNIHIRLTGSSPLGNLDNVVTQYCPPWPRPCPHSFVSENSHENFPMGHPSWDCSWANSLNSRV